ncbi:ParB N-terminal domain-containing protein [Streptomyces sp. NPDC020898]|uniref:ParB/RepB/Spo0J family partition protein n=1 Tax=Streptomyces sp. NPDC020898 TaxID=3365101 RepID=UPI0037A12790
MADRSAPLFESAPEGSDGPSTKSVLVESFSQLAKSFSQDVEPVPISSLMPGYSPRLQGEDAAHVARLAEVDGQLPPIVVERVTMRVIDGMHRLMAACAKGRETIEVRFFDGTAEEAFLLAVQSNMAHGLPLSREDRRAAAVRILALCPHLSDRAVARTAGIGAKTVAVLRATSVDVTPYPKARRGRDGKVRPLDGAEGRRKAAELLAERPHASLREVARRVGISPATVSDVRKRLASGRLPVPERDLHKEELTVGTQRRPKPGGSVVEETVSAMRSTDASLMDKLLRDPSLRHKESGRQLLRLLQRSGLERQELLKLAETVPSHCTDLVAALAREYAGMWVEFAQEVGESAS